MDGGGFFPDTAPSLALRRHGWRRFLPRHSSVPLVPLTCPGSPRDRQAFHGRWGRHRVLLSLCHLRVSLPRAEATSSITRQDAKSNSWNQSPHCITVYCQDTRWFVGNEREGEGGRDAP